MWQVVGDWAVAFLRRYPTASASELATAVEGLNQGQTMGFDVGPVSATAPETTRFGSVVDTRNPDAPAPLFGVLAEPEDFFAEMATFPLKATAMQIVAAPERAFSVAVTSAFWGRLLVVSRRGLLDSKRIHRLGVPRALQPLADGSARFYVDGRSDDWPTSYCRGGEVSIWAWRGGRLRRLLQDWYSDSGPDPGWGIHRGRRGLKVATRARTRTMTECCACTETAAVWTIRLTPDGIDDRGLRYVTPEIGQIDGLLYRTLRGDDVSDLATPEVADALAAVLKRFCRDDETSYRLGMINGWRITRDGDATLCSLDIDLDFTFRIGSRDGRPFVLAMPSPEPAVVAFMAAVRGKLRERNLCTYCAKEPDRRAAAESVLRERPELALPEEVVQKLVANVIPDLCEPMKWPWRRPGEGPPEHPSAS